MKTTEIKLPIRHNELLKLRAGGLVVLSGVLYTARDAAHKRMTEEILRGGKAPFDLHNAAIYYTGPTEAKTGEIIGSCGPTSSIRMNAYAPLLIENGLKIIIGKGNLGKETIEALKTQGAVYLAATGGAAALISRHITKCGIVAYADLGCEAVRELTVASLPLIVAIDSKGNSVFER